MKKSVIFSFLVFAGLAADAATWSLDSCINYAVEHNLTVRSRQLDVQSARNDVDEAYDKVLPTAQASAGQSWNFGRGLTSQNTYADRNTSNFQWNIGVNLPLFQGLSAIRQIDYSKASLRAIVESVEAAKEDVTLNVISQYLQVLYARELNVVAKSQLELSEYEYKRQQALVDAGKIPEADMLSAAAQCAQDRLQVVNTANDYQLALVDLAQLLRLSDVDGFDVEDLDDEEVAMLTNPEQIFRNALQNNHTMLAQHARVAAADKAISMAKTGYIPRLSFNAGLGSSYYTVGGMENPSFGEQMRRNYSTYFGFSLSIPIFDAFSTRNSVRRATVQRLSSELEYERLSDNLFKAIQQAYYQATGARQKIETSAEARRSTEETLKAVQEKFNLGRATPTEFETAKNNYLRASAENVQARYEYILRCRILEFYNRN